jgi:hypothetical protein
MPGVLTDLGLRTTAIPARRRPWRPTPYQLAGGAFWLAMSIAAWRTPIASDFGQHASAIERVKADWLHPANPLLDLPGTHSPYFTPYTVALGLMAKATGLAGWQVLKACGPFNLALIITGIGAFTRTLSTRRWAPVLALGAFVLLWGPVFKEWSGFLGAQSMTRGLTYPSAFAIGLTFWCWALTGRLARRGAGLLPYGALGLLTGVILLVHPITAVGTAIGMAALALGWQRRWTPLAVVPVALAVAAAWPYFTVFALVGDPTVDAVHRGLYHDLWGWYGLALAGLPALLWRLRRNRLDPLVVMFALYCAVAAYGWFSGHYTYGRIFGLLLVPLQFALAVELAEGRTTLRLHAARPRNTSLASERPDRTPSGQFLPQPSHPSAPGSIPHFGPPQGTRSVGLSVGPMGPAGAWAAGAERTARRGEPAPVPRPLLALSAVLAVAAAFVGLLAQGGALLPERLGPFRFQTTSVWAGYGWAAHRTRPGDVLLTDGDWSTHVMPAYGVFLVASTWPDPSVPAAVRRRRGADVHSYLAPSATPADQRRIARLYHVRWVMAGGAEPAPADGTLVATGPVTHERLYRLAG